MADTLLLGDDGHAATNWWTNDYFTLVKYQAVASGNATQIRVYGRVSGHMKVAIYADSAGAPGARLSYNNDSQEVTADQWNTLTIPEVAITQGTDYWLAFNMDNDYTLEYGVSGVLAAKRKAATYSTFTFPDPAGSGFTNTSGEAAIGAWEHIVVVTPTVQTNDADNILDTSAKLHGKLLDDGGEACSVRFQYGETTGYGTNTTWQEGKVTNDLFEQLIESLDPDKTYHFRAQAHNSEGDGYGQDKQFTTLPPPPPPPTIKKVLITHPGLKKVRVMREGQQSTVYDQLSDLDQQRLESGLSIPVPTPATVEVTTIADQVYTFIVT